MILPSKQIEMIRQELSKNDWIAWGGNSIMKDDWDSDTDLQNSYYIQAIVEYLDRKEKRLKCISIQD